MDIGTSAGAARRLRSLTQADLAHLSGIERVTIAKIECGMIRHPRITTLVPLADALGLSLDDLIGRKPPPANRAGRCT